MNCNMGRKNCDAHEKKILGMLENQNIFDEINLRNNELNHE